MNREELEKKLEQGNLTDDDYRYLMKLLIDDIKQRIDEAKKEASAYMIQGAYAESTKIAEPLNNEK